jgi:hypothetical protein
MLPLVRVPAAHEYCLNADPYVSVTTPACVVSCNTAMLYRATLPEKSTAHVTPDWSVGTMSALAVIPLGNTALNVDVSASVAPSVTTSTPGVVVSIVGNVYTSAVATITGEYTVPYADVSTKLYCSVADAEYGTLNVRKVGLTVAVARSTFVPFTTNEKRSDALSCGKPTVAVNANVSVTGWPTTSLLGERMLVPIQATLLGSHCGAMELEGTVSVRSELCAPSGPSNITLTVMSAVPFGTIPVTTTV